MHPRMLAKTQERRGAGEAGRRGGNEKRCQLSARLLGCSEHGNGLKAPPLCNPRAQSWEWIGVEKAAAQAVALFRLVPQLANTTLDLLQAGAPE